MQQSGIWDVYIVLVNEIFMVPLWFEQEDVCIINVIWTSGETTVNSGQQSLMIKSTIGCFTLSFIHLYFSCDTELYACILLLESLKIYRYHFLYPVIFVSRVIFKKYIDVYKCIKVSLILCEILKAYSLQTVKRN